MKLFEPNLAVSHYKIISAIGKGGMVQVYRANDQISLSKKTTR